MVIVSSIDKVQQPSKNLFWLIVCLKLIDLTKALSIQENLHIAWTVASRKQILKELALASVGKNNFLTGWNAT